MYELGSHKIFTSRDVLFHEDHFLFFSSIKQCSPHVLHCPLDDLDGNVSPISPLHSLLAQTPSHTTLDESNEHVSSPLNSHESNSAIASPPITHKSTRPTKLLNYLQDFHLGCGLPSRATQSSDSALVTSSSTSYSLSNLFLMIVWPLLIMLSRLLFLLK